MMQHHIEYTLNPDLKDKLRITWNGGYYGKQKNITIYYNGVPLKLFSQKDELLTPQTIPLPRQNPIKIWLDKSHFVIYQDGRPISEQKLPVDDLTEFYKFTLGLSVIYFLSGLYFLVSYFTKVPRDLRLPNLGISLVIIFSGILLFMVSRIGDIHSVWKLAINIFLLLFGYIAFMFLYPILQLGEDPHLGAYITFILWLNWVFKGVMAYRKHHLKSRRGDPGTP